MAFSAIIAQTNASAVPALRSAKRLKRLKPRAGLPAGRKFLPGRLRLVHHDARTVGPVAAAVIAMKIDFATLASSPSASRHAAPRSAAPGFRLPGLENSVAPQGPAAVSRLPSPGLIAAIASHDARQERRRKRHGHAADLLDRLDRLTCDLVMGQIESGRLDALRTALSAGGEASDDPVLEELVAAVELRAAVELAKLKARQGRV